MFVEHRFELSESLYDRLKSLIPPFGYNGFGEFIFYRTYSRVRKDGGQEDWADCVARVTEGTFSIRKDWYLKNRIAWDESFWQSYAEKFALSMFRMEWMPPGRGLWAMGSDFVYERGAMALYNCAYTDLTTREFSEDISWLMDSLMHGVGVGFGPVRDDRMRIWEPQGQVTYRIPDSREGWCESVRMLIDAYMRPNEPKPIFDYSLIREAGLPIRGFGGISSGPGPLRELHQRIENEFKLFATKPQYDSVYLKTNIANHVGCCVVAGNVRRSAELAKGKVTDPTFLNLKDYKKFPEREGFGWMSNNSVELETDEDFMMLGEIAERVIKNGEPGYINRRNMPLGRIGKKMKGLRKDMAVGFNPCGEIPLEHREVCNVAETLPTMCVRGGDGYNHETWLRACGYCTTYMTTVSLLPTHQESTNRVVARNRRIGGSIVDFTGWIHDEGVHRVTKYMRQGYKKVRETAKWSNEEAGIPLPIRHTTVKPGGTGPKLPGKTPGISYPNFHEMIRRVRVAKNSPVHGLLSRAGVPHEQDRFDKYTDVFEYPIVMGPAKPAEDVTLWQQAMNLILVQREWADNAVSNTLNFRPMWPLYEVLEGEEVREGLERYIGFTETSLLLSDRVETHVIPERYKIVVKYSETGPVEAHVHEYNAKHEEDDIEPVLSAIAPLTKSVALLPHSAKGAYKQMPEEGISVSEYQRRLAAIQPIDWSELSGSDGIDERYCSGPLCEVPT